MVGALIWRDLLIALRGGQGTLLALAFFLAFGLLLPLGLGNDPVLIGRAGPAVLFTGALLAMLLTFDRIFALDGEDGSLDLLRTGGTPPLAIAAAKIVVLWLTAGLPVLLVAPVLAVMLQIPATVWMVLVVALLAATLAYAVIGAFCAALILPLRRAGMILPVLVLPLSVPIHILATLAVRAASDGQAALPLLAVLGGTVLAIAALLPLATARALTRHR